MSEVRWCNSWKWFLGRGTCNNGGHVNTCHAYARLNWLMSILPPTIVTVELKGVRCAGYFIISMDVFSLDGEYECSVPCSLNVWIAWMRLHNVATQCSYPMRLHNWVTHLCHTMWLHNWVMQYGHIMWLHNAVTSCDYATRKKNTVAQLGDTMWLSNWVIQCGYTLWLLNWVMQCGCTVNTFAGDGCHKVGSCCMVCLFVDQLFVRSIFITIVVSCSLFIRAIYTSFCHLVNINEVYKWKLMIKDYSLYFINCIFCVLNYAM